MTEEVTNLIAALRRDVGINRDLGRHRLAELHERAADALARSATETRDATDEETILRAADLLEEKKGFSTAGTLRAYVKAGYFVAVVPEDAKPIVLSDLDQPVEHPRGGGVRLEDPKPLDPEPWLDIESGHRLGMNNAGYAKWAALEWSPRPQFEQHEARYGVNPTPGGHNAIWKDGLVTACTCDETHDHPVSQTSVTFRPGVTRPDSPRPGELGWPEGRPGGRGE